MNSPQHRAGSGAPAEESQAPSSAMKPVTPMPAQTPAATQMTGTQMTGQSAIRTGAAPAPAAGAGESASRRRKAVAGGRLDYLDAVRAVAIIGMLITHLVQLSKVPDKVQFVFDGRASIVFAVLAGVSAVLLTRSVARRKGQADPGEMTSAGAMTLLKRGLLLYVICLIVAPLSVGPVVILGTYAVLMVLAIPLLYIRDTRILIALSAVSAVALPVLSYFLRSQVLPVNDAQGLVPGFTDFFSLGTMVASAQGLFFDGFYPVLTFAPFLMAGLVIGRVLTGALWRGGDVMKGLFATGSGLILLGYGTSIFVRTQTGYTQQRIDEVAQGAMSPEELNPDMVANMPPEMVEQMLHPTYNPFESQMGVTGLSNPRALLVAVPHSGSITEIIGGIGVATVLIAAMAFAFRFAAPVLKPLANLGRASLTYYIGHIVVLSIAALIGLQDQNLFLVLLVMVVLPIYLAHLWFKKHKRGPLEQMMHKFSAVK